MEGNPRRPRTTLLSGHRLINVAGESHYQESLRAIAGGEPDGPVRHEAEALLVPEPSNSHDPNAVMVQIDGRLVGYLPRAEAVAYGPLVRAIAERGRVAACEALVSGRGGVIGVFLRLPDPDEER